VVTGLAEELCAADINGTLTFVGQAVGPDDPGRPDIVGSNTGGPRLILEAKFDAALTPAQLDATYLNRLPAKQARGACLSRPVGSPSHFMAEVAGRSRKGDVATSAQPQRSRPSLPGEADRRWSNTRRGVMGDLALAARHCARRRTRCRGARGPTSTGGPGRVAKPLWVGSGRPGGSAGAHWPSACGSSRRGDPRGGESHRRQVPQRHGRQRARSMD
jgi:hypothetical protein